MFSAVKVATFFRRLPNYFFTESSSFLCEKTTMKISGLVNEIFSQVVINLEWNTTSKSTDRTIIFRFT